MGKGDRRTKRGKTFRGTFGKSRKHKAASKATATSEPAAKKKAAPAKKKKAAKKKAE